jgi:hypothetical protein
MVRIAAVFLAAGLSVSACARRADAPPADAPGVGPGARVQVVAERLGPGWHGGLVGSVGECVVVMVGEPPEAPVRLYPVEFAEISRLRVSDRYDGDGDPPRRWTPGADTSGERWTQVSLQALVGRYGDCTS